MEATVFKNGNKYKKCNPITRSAPFKNMRIIASFKLHVHTCLCLTALCYVFRITSTVQLIGRHCDPAVRNFGRDSQVQPSALNQLRFLTSERHARAANDQGAGSGAMCIVVQDLKRSTFVVVPETDRGSDSYLGELASTLARVLT